MEVLNYTEFRKNLAQTLNKINEDEEIVLVNRSKGKNVVVMSLDEYNAINETLHLTQTAANRKRVQHAFDEMQTGKFKRHKLIEK